MKQFLLILACTLSLVSGAWAQDATVLVKRYLSDHQKELNLSQQEIQNWLISDQYLTKHNQVTHVYLQQTLNDLPLHLAVSSVAIKNGEVKVFNSRFVPKAAQKANLMPGAQSLDVVQAIRQTAEYLQIDLGSLTPMDANTDKSLVFQAEKSANKPVRAKLLYFNAPEEIRLAWFVEISHGSDYWHLCIDAADGQLLHKGNYTVYCNFHQHGYRGKEHSCEAVRTFAAPEQAPLKTNATSAYNVFPFPVESPNHGSRQLITDPADPTASPFGWHDEDGVPGADYTITRGNNVWASEDRGNLDEPGHSPDGGLDLVFDHPYNGNDHPQTWQDAAITNLFYANNFMHDMAYHFGFDEPSGNYQVNNYGNGGAERDAVFADAQDGSGVSNANFQAPADGESGRMQMYIWRNEPFIDSLKVNAPAAAVATYVAPIANFGGPILTAITSDIVLVVDDTAPTSNACETIVNGADLAGKIAMVDRGGGCTSVEKVRAIQDAGAIAVVVVNNQTTPPSDMTAGFIETSDDIVIPSVMISQAAGNAIKAALANGPVNITLPRTGGSDKADSDVDNGVIAHEYGHGISIRLTGGPSNSSCLDNAEQMGEGWSDFYALITTMLPTDTRNTVRPVGTYSYGQPVNGAGIRNQLYSTDMSVNDYTYASLNGTQGEVHNIGEIWTAMLWDLTWDLIDVYGFNPDPYGTTGGNNIAQQLVMDGYKLQPCNPGFVDGRNAILAADELNYGGANRCVIWKAFARRGLGFSASQGSSNDYTDGVESFDIPTFCQIAVSSPSVDFTVDRNTACLGISTFKFKDQTQNIAHTWLWDFGDGTTSTQQNPVHTYSNAGTFNVQLIVTNNIGADTLVKTAYISVQTIQTPSVADVTICEGQTATLSATPSDAANTMEWSDTNGSPLFTGATFTTAPLATTTTFKVNEATTTTVQHVGPTTFGSGGNHNTSFIGQLYFTAEKAFTIKSVLVRAQGAGDRTIRLFDKNGVELDAVTVNIPNGQGRITLNLKVPSAGDFAIGAGPNVNLYRNNLNTVFPFTIAGLVSITGTNSGQPGFYYYFYDWEVQETPCRSAASEVTVHVTPGPVANFSSTATGLSVQFSDLSTGAPTSWNWDFGDGSSSNLPNVTHVYAAPGVYTVTLTVSNGSCTTTATQTVSFSTGTQQLNPDDLQLELTPNPAGAFVTILFRGNVKDRAAEVSLFSADGRLVRSVHFGDIQDGKLRLSLEDISKGMYLVKVETDSGSAFRKLAVH